MKNTIFLVVFLLSANIFSSQNFPVYKQTEGCGSGLTCTSDNGISVKYPQIWPNNSDTIHVSSIDSMTLYLKNSPCNVSLTGITIDGAPANYVYSNQQYIIRIRLLLIHGKYRVSGTAQGSPQSVSFGVILDPVGIPKYSKESEVGLSIFPNPATKELNIHSKNGELKNVKIYNTSGQELENKKVDGNEIEIPLNNYPSGIYFIHVATISDKIIIKKISVL